MELQIGRYSLSIYPSRFDNSQKELDVAYIEEVLGLKQEDDTATVTRKNTMGLHSIALLEIKKTSSASA